jgi:predicted nuclease of predicted toxin-antitoxin system
MARIYTNENFPLPVVEELRQVGHDMLTSYECGQAGRAIPDAEVLAFATENERILLTMNRRHFIRLHSHNPQHTGIIVCTVDPDFVALAQRIHQALEAQPDMIGQLVRVNRPSR